MKASPDNAKKKIEKLKIEVARHERAYYVLDEPVMSDTEFDSLLKKLEKLEAEKPELITPDSPTQRVGGKVSGGLRPVRHTVLMMSLDNTYTPGELYEWEKRNFKIHPETGCKYVVEPKIDGVSCSVLYEGGYLKVGATRGDGQSGEDITSNIKTIHTIPLKLQIEKKSDVPDYLEVRGEVYIDKADFRMLNEERKKEGQAVFANPRNAASGTLKLLDPAIVSSRKLKFLPHSFGRISGGPKISSHTGFYEIIKKAGFKMARDVKVCKGIENAMKLCSAVEAARNEYEYEIDGMVIKIDDFDLRDKLKETAKSPRWAIAYKFSARQATTIVESVKFQVGRTGAVTPVAELRPVECGGVTISRATLHNFEEVKRLDVGSGDRVLIERAGDVIPKVIKVVEKTGKRTPINIPETCPECGTTIIKEKEKEVAYRCPNTQCPAQMIRGVLHFASRNAMDIEGLGEAAVEQLVENGSIKDPSDIYSLKAEDLLRLDLYAEKKAHNLISSIKKSKKKSLSRFIFALGIRNVGEKAARTLAGSFGSLEKLAEATKDELTMIPEIGPVMADSIVEFFRNSKTTALLEKIKGLGVKPASEDIPKNEGALKGMKFVFTGGLERLPRSKAQSMVLAAGGEVSGAVSIKTDFVVAGTDPGSKYGKAKKLKVRILSEGEFLKLMEQ